MRSSYAILNLQIEQEIAYISYKLVLTAPTFFITTSRDTTMPFDPALLRALLAACAAVLLVQALPARAPRLLDQALALATGPVAGRIPRFRLGMIGGGLGRAGAASPRAARSRCSTIP